jgi:hypothetical protein
MPDFLLGPGIVVDPRIEDPERMLGGFFLSCQGAR